MFTDDGFNHYTGRKVCCMMESQMKIAPFDCSVDELRGINSFSFRSYHPCSRFDLEFAFPSSSSVRICGASEIAPYIFVKLFRMLYI